MTAKKQLPGRGIKVASFFSGAGGLDLGFHKAGFEVVFASDVEPLCCDTLLANSGAWTSPDMEVVCGDIRKIEAMSLPNDIDFVIGGPPCQSFSASGRRAGGAAGRLDSRGTLFQAYCSIIERLNPKGFLFENVRGILGTNKGRDWSEIEAAFRRLGYHLSFRVLDACDYGIPQHRERLLLVGHRLNYEFLFPAPTFGSDSPDDRHHISPEQAFSGLQRDEDLDSLRLGSGKYSHLLASVPPGGNYLFFTSKRGHPTPIFAYRSRFSDFLYKANPDYPIKTLIASPGKYTGPFHWENRRFCIAEYKRLQGFPDDYKFRGSRSDVVKQIGNSVSPNIAEFLALAIANQVFGRKTRVELLPNSKRLSFDQRKGKTAQDTREKHIFVAQSEKPTDVFSIETYETRAEPCSLDAGKANVFVQSCGRTVQMRVEGDGSRSLFAEMRIEIALHPADLFTTVGTIAEVTLDIVVAGDSPHCIQTMWNAIDDWVIRSSSFHSLYELYGHFTEPHPVFSIVSFVKHSKHPIASFATYVANFGNCSRYLPRAHLTDMFGQVFGTDSFSDLVKVLRGYRFDIRCHETNIAIPKTVYMVAYPFTLPHRKQMNFSVKDRQRQIAIPLQP